MKPTERNETSHGPASPQPASPAGATCASSCRSTIDQLAGTFEPEQYEDEYRATLERVIEAKLGAGEPVTAAPAPARGQVVDLMEALKASIQATKKEGRGKEPTAAAPKKQIKKAAVG